MPAPPPDRPLHCPLRVAHGVIRAGESTDVLPARLSAADWDMVELDVLRVDGELIVAHDSGDLQRPRPLHLAVALEALARTLPPHVRVDVDVKATGYEAAVAAAIDASGLAERTLVSTMELSSLQALRRIAPGLTRGLSVPLARRNYLGHPLTRPAAYAMLAYLRRVLPDRCARALEDGVADAIMANHHVVTPRLVAAARAADAELYAWTVDDPARLPALVELGVTGVITNEPGLFAAAPG